jgi:lysophospholipase L1-like esterase
MADTAQSNGQTSVVFIGDSFTEGAGLRDRSFRYTDLLRYKLGGCFKVFNLGKDGYSTTEELETMQSLAFRPDVIVLQYFFNDPDITCHEVLGWYPELNVYAGIGAIQTVLVKGSFLVNYVFYRFYEFPMIDEYMSFFRECFQDTEGVSKYRNQIDRVAQFARDNGIILYVLVIPHTVDDALTREQDSLVAAMYAEQGVRVIDATEIICGIPLGERIISHRDLHLTERGHQELASLLYPVLLEHCSIQ